jgi:hypothetical protein
MNSLALLLLVVVLLLSLRLFRRGFATRAELTI